MDWITVRRRLAGAARDCRGAEVIEFALALPVLLIVVAGILDMGFLLNNYQTLTNAAREGARMAAVPGWVEKDVKDRVSLYLQSDGMDSGAVDTKVTPVQIAVPGGSMNGVRVVVSYPYNYMMLGAVAHLFQGQTSNAITLKAAATMRSEIAAGL